MHSDHVNVRLTYYQTSEPDRLSFSFENSHCPENSDFVLHIDNYDTTTRTTIVSRDPRDPSFTTSLVSPQALHVMGCITAVGDQTVGPDGYAPECMQLTLPAQPASSGSAFHVWTKYHPDTPVLIHVGRTVRLYVRIGRAGDDSWDMESGTTPSSGSLYAREFSVFAMSDGFVPQVTLLNNHNVLIDPDTDEPLQSLSFTFDFEHEAWYTDIKARGDFAAIARGYFHRPTCMRGVCPDDSVFSNEHGQLVSFVVSPLVLSWQDQVDVLLQQIYDTVVTPAPPGSSPMPPDELLDYCDMVPGFFIDGAPSLQARALSDVVADQNERPLNVHLVYGPSTSLGHLNYLDWGDPGQASSDPAAPPPPAFEAQYWGTMLYYDEKGFVPSFSEMLYDGTPIPRADRETQVLDLARAPYVELLGDDETVADVRSICIGLNKQQCRRMQIYDIFYVSDNDMVFGTNYGIILGVTSSELGQAASIEQMVFSYLPFAKNEKVRVHYERDELTVHAFIPTMSKPIVCMARVHRHGTSSTMYMTDLRDTVDLYTRVVITREESQLDKGFTELDWTVVAIPPGADLPGLQGVGEVVSDAAYISRTQEIILAVINEVDAFTLILSLSTRNLDVFGGSIPITSQDAWRVAAILPKGVLLPKIHVALNSGAILLLGNELWTMEIGDLQPGRVAIAPVYNEPFTRAMSNPAAFGTYVMTEKGSTLYVTPGVSGFGVASTQTFVSSQRKNPLYTGAPGDTEPEYLPVKNQQTVYPVSRGPFIVYFDPATLLTTDADGRYLLNADWFTTTRAAPHIDAATRTHKHSVYSQRAFLPATRTEPLPTEGPSRGSIGGCTITPAILVSSDLLWVRFESHTLERTTWSGLFADDPAFPASGEPDPTRSEYDTCKFGVGSFGAQLGPPAARFWADRVAQLAGGDYSAGGAAPVLHMGTPAVDGSYASFLVTEHEHSAFTSLPEMLMAYNPIPTLRTPTTTLEGVCADDPCLVGSEVTLTLAGGGMWPASGVGLTLRSGTASILVTRVTSDTVATGKLLAPTLPVGPQSMWIYFDGRPVADFLNLTPTESAALVWGGAGDHDPAAPRSPSPTGRTPQTFTLTVPRDLSAIESILTQWFVLTRKLTLRVLSAVVDTGAGTTALTLSDSVWATDLDQTADHLPAGVVMLAPPCPDSAYGRTRPCAAVSPIQAPGCRRDPLTCRRGNMESAMSNNMYLDRFESDLLELRLTPIAFSSQAATLSTAASALAALNSFYIRPLSHLGADYEVISGRSDLRSVIYDATGSTGAAGVDGAEEDSASLELGYEISNDLRDRAGALYRHIRISGKNGPGVLSFRPDSLPASPLCLDAGATFAVLLDCPPGRHLEVNTHSHATAGATVHNLPTNYRPPSWRGMRLPLTTNVYNSDPSQPPYEKPSFIVHDDVLRSVKESFVYHQCSGAADRAQCECYDAMRVSEMSQYSDCLRSAPRHYYEDNLKPTFVLSDDVNGHLGGGRSDLSDAMVAVTEINNRTDWFVDTTPEAYTYKADVWPADQSSAVAHWAVLPLYKASDLSIEFRAGELYHFRFAVVGHSSCTLEAERMVWVYDAPKPEIIDFMVIASVGVVLIITFLVWYIVRFTKTGPRFLR